MCVSVRGYVPQLAARSGFHTKFFDQSEDHELLLFLIQVLLLE